MPKKQIKEKEKPKRLRAKIKVGTYSDGKPVIKWAHGYTAAELEENKAELRKTYIGNAIKVDRDILVCTCVERWYADTKDDGLAVGSKKNLALAINSYINPKIGQKRMQAVTHENLRDIMDSVSSKGKTLIGDVYSVLTGIFAYAAGRRIIDYNPAEGLKKPSAEPKSRRALTEAETAAVLKLIDETTDHADKLLLMTLYYLGSRKGEALGHQWSDYNFKDGTVHTQRDIDFKSTTRGAVDSVKSTASDRVQHWNQSTYARHWKKLMARLYEIDPSIEHRQVTDRNAYKNSKGVRIPATKTTISILTAHYFRHNYATLLYYAGVDLLDAQRYLGHEDPETTLHIYTHLQEVSNHPSRAKIDNIFQAKRAESKE